MVTGSVDLVEMAQHQFFTRRLGRYGKRPARPAFVMTLSGCFEWQGAVNSKGYPCDGNGLLHRQAWEMFMSEIPPGFDVHHICKNKLCSRIDHLGCLSHAEHVELDRRSILSEWEVREIHARLAAGERIADIAAWFSVSASHICKIKSGTRWPHMVPANAPLPSDREHSSGFERMGETTVGKALTA